ncbi:MAG: M23 family metallopeptidase [Gemmatimonadota bacterium]|nr:M23 family metallopeptidase [Gemmatimonadota bacterium]
MRYFKRDRTDRPARSGRRFRLAEFASVILPAAVLAWLVAARAPAPQSARIPDVGQKVPAVPVPRPVTPETWFSEIDGRILRNETFWDALNREDVKRSQIHDLLNAFKKGIPRAEFNPRIVRRGDRYALGLDSLGAIQSFEFIRKGALETRFVVTRTNGRLTARKEQIPLERRVDVVTGEIRSSLWNALSESGEEADVLTGNMAGIFEYDIDFMVDCRAGDRFALALEKFYKDGRFLRYGEILSAEYQSARKNHQAFLFETADGRSTYYDSNGKSLRGLFLKSPLNYRRISSGFSNRRFHPILKKYLPHHGIDYAAAYGTRVWATAPGVVVFRGWRGALGNYVEIRHRNGYKTGYGHLSRFPRGLRVGTRVKQKQTVGFVGSTGRSTGPHLHYNFFVRNGKAYRLVNPSNFANRSRARQLSADQLAEFRRQRDRLLALFDDPATSLANNLQAPP